MPSDASLWILVIDDDRELAEGLALGLERPDRTVVVCNNVESAEMVLERFPVTHVVSDVQFTSAFGFEGLHFAKRSRSGRALQRRVLMTGIVTDALRAAAPAFGVDAILEKPFAVADLERALGIDGPPSPGAEGRIVRVGTVEEMIAADGVTVAFQPIVELAGDEVRPFAFEALARTRQVWPLGHVGELFDYAARCSRLAELNRAAMQAALREASLLPGDPILFVNVDPPALDARLAAGLVDAAEESGFPLRRVVLELTERAGFPDERAAADLLGQLRARGVRFALDDHGSAYSHLRMVQAIEPAFIKISATFGSEFEKDVHKQRIVRNTANLARDLGARTILEGVETAETASLAREIAIPLAQGYFFGRPAPVGQWT